MSDLSLMDVVQLIRSEIARTEIGRRQANHGAVPESKAHRVKLAFKAHRGRVVMTASKAQPEPRVIRARRVIKALRVMTALMALVLPV